MSVETTDVRFLEGTYITDGTILWRVVGIELENDAVTVVVEDSIGLWHEQSHSWHYRQLRMAVDEVRNCDLVRPRKVA